MALLWYYSVDASTVLEITDRVEIPVAENGQAIGVGSKADAGAGWEGDLYINDPGGTLPRPKLHRRVYAVQDAAPAGAQVIGNWFINRVRVQRWEPWSGAARRYVVAMADENSLLRRRKFVGTDSDRDSETDIVRLRWALTTTELNVLSPDETFIDTTNPVTLDAVDLRQQSPSDMLMAMFQRSGKHYWVKYVEAAAVGGAIVSSSVANPTVITTTSAHGLYTGMQVTIAGHSGSTPSINGTHTITVTSATTYTIPVNVTVGGTGGTTTAVGRYVLWYSNQNTTTIAYASTVTFSNDTADSIISGDNPTSLVYPLSADAELDGSGDRLASGVIVSHAGPQKFAYAQNTAVGDAYAYVDQVSPAPHVKDQSSALAQAQRELAELDTPDDEVTTTWTVQAARLNLVMHGMTTTVNSTYFPNFTDDDAAPGWEDGAVACRVMERVITQIGPTTFGVALRLSPIVTPSNEQYGTQLTQGGYAGATWPEGDVTSGHLLIGALAQRAVGSFGSAIVPIATTELGNAAANVAGTGWTFIAGIETNTNYSTDRPGYPITMAWRQATASDTNLHHWGVQGTALNGSSGPRAHFAEIAITPGAPSVTATAQDQPVSGATFTSPNIVTTGAGYIFGIMGYNCSGPADGFSSSFTMDANAATTHILSQGFQYSSFGGYSVFFYRYVSAAGTYSFSFTRTAAPRAGSDYSFILGYWAAAAATEGFPA